nr:hypothetical protein CFP56_40830 [Quercus suber]POE87059.1 hypothetical protein CFP56_77432 [Quercus suber]
MNNPNNAGDDDLTLLEADQNTVRPKAQAQAQQSGSNPAVTVRAQVRHDVRYHNFMRLQDRPLLHECFVCQTRYPSERALSGHMKRHSDREWRGLYPPHTPNAIRPPFFDVPGFCPPPIAESSVSTGARGRGTDAREREDSPCTPLKFDLNKVPDDEDN